MSSLYIHIVRYSPYLQTVELNWYVLCRKSKVESKVHRVYFATFCLFPRLLNSLSNLEYTQSNFLTGETKPSCKCRCVAWHLFLLHVSVYLLELGNKTHRTWKKKNKVYLWEAIHILQQIKFFSVSFVKSDCMGIFVRSGPGAGIRLMKTSSPWKANKDKGKQVLVC